MIGDYPKTAMPIIKEWIAVSKSYEKEINYKEICRLSKKEIVKQYSSAKPLAVNFDNVALIKTRFPKYNIENYYDNPKLYFKDLFSLIKSIKEFIKGNKFIDHIEYCLPNGISTYKSSVIHFTYNMILWMPFFILNIDITPDLIFHEKVFNNKTYCSYVNNNIINKYKYLTTHNEMSLMLAKMYDLFIIISEQNALLLACSFSLYDLISKWDDPEIYDINHTKIPKKMNIHESEVFLTEQVNRYKDIMMNLPDDNILKPLLRSGQGVNTKQLREFAISIGFKPDPSGYTYTVKPKTSFISNGLRDPLSFVIDSTAGRYAAILALEIDTSGYLQRTLCKEASNIFADPDSNYDCGSVNYYVKEIKDKECLYDMRGRYYLDESTNTLNELIETDYDKIGSTLKFRSPATCNCHKDGRGICKICMGHLYEENKYINLGINSVLRLSEENYQNTMSVKHILDTNTGVFSFNDEFYDYFTIDSFVVRVRDDIELPENYLIRINVNTIYRDAQINDLINNEYIKDFELFDIDENRSIPMTEINDNPIYISDVLLRDLFRRRREHDYDEEGWMTFKLSDISPEEDIFFTKLKNKEITKPLKDLRRTIEKGKEIEDVNSISEFISKVFNLFKAGGVNAESVHTEILVRNLIRDKNNNITLPDYSIPNVEYTLTSVHNSILTSDSVITSLTFERLAQQFRDPMTYNKHGLSPLDRLFIKE